MLVSEDPHEVAVLNATLRRAVEVRQELAKAQAVEIANAVGQALSGKG